MSLNKVILIGYLGRDPEIRHMPSGEAVCNFSLATSEKWKDKTTGQKQEKVEFHNISMFGRLAEVAGKWLKKGSQVYIEGRIQSRKYTDKTGVERVVYEIIANEMKMLGGNPDAVQSGQAAPRQPHTPHAPPKPPSARPPSDPAAPFDDIDDDIPF